MEEPLKIVIPGCPVSQARMKGTARGGFVRMYDPKAKEKDLIKLKLKSFKQERAFSYPRISFLFEMPIPSSTTKKELKELEKGLIKHDKKPDCDNLVKLYLDCLTEDILEDDRNVSLGSVNKIYSKDPKTTILIRNTSQKIEQWEMDSEFFPFEESSKPTSFEKDFPPDSCDQVDKALPLSHHSSDLPPLISALIAESFAPLDLE